LEHLKSVVERFGAVGEEEVAAALANISLTRDDNVVVKRSVEVLAPGKQVRARSPGQSEYVEAIRKYPLVIAEGPAGTGKTYLAVAVAVEAFKRSEVRKIVLVRPAVEAGESLGFLPGDMYAKINPYLRPLLDALYEMMSFEQVKQYMERDSIEVVPLAYMRGRTLNEAFIILDEAQNTTISQMKMFLTRMGQGSRIVVAGDSTQIDLPAHAQSGMNDAIVRLRNIEGVCLVRLGKADIVRHRLVQDIVHAYEEGRKKRR
jgi:phosphate starvation-inducible PhoH-like protein